MKWRLAVNDPQVLPAGRTVDKEMQQVVGPDIFLSDPTPCSNVSDLEDVTFFCDLFDFCFAGVTPKPDNITNFKFHVSCEA